MAVDMFLKIDGIKGESTDSTHKEEIEVLSWGWGLAQAYVPSGAGHGSGKADAADFTITKRTDKSTPILVKHCASGEHVKSMLLTLRKAGKQQLEYTKISFSDVMIAGVTLDSHGDYPSESVAFRFGKIKLEYWPQKADGSLGGVVPYEWDIAANKP